VTRWRSKTAEYQVPLLVAGDTFTRGDVIIHNADVLTLYEKWRTPVVIISDGPYGVGTFFRDVATPEELPGWYEPHIRAWSERATAQTTLWFWNSEIGWATTHPILVKYGWKYVNCNIWDKGISHAAGNSNTKTLRQLPVVTEVCVQYVREARVNGLSLKDWLRQEWERSGLPLSKANEACGVRNAATRKYLTKDHLWYFPPPDMFVGLSRYANEQGKPEGRPYFSADGDKPITGAEWARMRAKFYCKPGLTNVWREPPLHGSERLKTNGRSTHLNQKPLKLIELIIELSSDPDDLVWEPFGGLCTGAVASFKLGRRCVSAEIERYLFQLAAGRLMNA
jgi:hypothetical protein